MSEEPKIASDVQSLVDRALDGALSIGEIERLEHILRTDTAARSYYLRSAQLIADAVLLMRAEEGTQRAVDTISFPENAERATATNKNQAERPGLRGLANRLARRVELRDHPWRFACLAGLGTAIAWMILFSFIWPRVDHPRLALPAAPANAQAPIVAQVVGSLEARLRDDRLSLLPGGHVRQGETLDLTTGLVELKFNSGAKVLLEGPARLTLTSAETAELASGRLTSEVPAEAVGFVIETPRVRIVDLGTRFGVEVADSQHTHVRVFEGAVELTQKTGADQAPGRPIQLLAGQEWTLAADKPVTLAGDAEITDRRPWVEDLPKAGEWPYANFERPAYAAGQLAGQMDWMVAAAENAQIVVEDGNHVFSFRGAEGRREASRSLAGWPIAAEGRGTLFFRVKPLDASLNIGIGLSSELRPDSWNDYEVQVVLYGKGTPLHLRGRDGNVFQDLTGELQEDRWYSVWLIFDRDQELFDVYLQGGSYAERTRLGQDLRFRNGGHRLLRAFEVRSAHDDQSQGVLIDDIYIIPGISHADPSASQQRTHSATLSSH